MRKNYTMYLIKERMKKIFEDEFGFVHEYWKLVHISFDYHTNRFVDNKGNQVVFDDLDKAVIHVTTTVRDFAENFEEKYYDMLESEDLIRLFEFFIRSQMDRQKVFIY